MIHSTRFDEDQAIKAAETFLREDDDGLGDLPESHVHLKTMIGIVDRLAKALDEEREKTEGLQRLIGDVV